MSIFTEEGRKKVLAGARKSAKISRENSLRKYYADPVVCENCGKILVVPDGKKVSDIRKKSFCDRKCSVKFNNRLRRKIRYCLNCNKELKSVWYKIRYCSNKCHRGYEWKIKKERIEKGETFSAFTMKKYLIEKFGSKCQSEECGWNWSKPCGIELEHIDGDSLNNNLNNLTLLCPNCHSMTDTYKNRNKGKGRYYRRQRYKEGKSY